jgi:hypothetical protein
MPGQGAVVPLTLKAELSDLRKEMAKIPGITEEEAKKMAGKLKKSFDQAAKDSRKLTSKIKRDRLKAGQAIVKSTKAAAAASKKAAEEAAEAQTKAAEESSQAWKDFGAKAVATFLAAGLAAIALTQDVADSRNAIVDLSARTDVATGTLEGMKLALAGSGRGLEDLNEIINPLVGQLAQLRAGSTAVEDKFNNLGISVRDASGDFADNDTILKRVVKTMQAAEDGSDKTAIAVGALGEGGGKLNEVFGDTALEAYIAQAAQFPIVGDGAAASAAAWQRSMADLSLVMDSSLASTSDFLNVGPKLDMFVVGFVAAGAAVGAITDHIAQGMATWSAILSGDLVPGTAAWTEAGEAAEFTFADVADAAEDAAFEFLENKRAMTETAGAAETTTSSIGNLATSHKAATEAAKEQKQAEQDLASVFNLASNAVDSLADSRATASEMLVNQSQVDIRAVEAAEAKAIGSGAARVQAEAAAAVAIQAIRQKLREDIETIQLEQLEDVALPILEREMDANATAADAIRDKRAESAKEQEEVATALAMSLISSAAEVTQALIDGLSRERENWIASQTERLALMEMESEARLAASQSAEQLLLNELKGREDLTADQQALLDELLAAEEAATSARIDSLTNEFENREEIAALETALQEKIDNDQATLLLMEFRRKRAAALGSIAMDTAAAIALGFAQLGPIGGAAAIIPTAAMGIAQAAIVLGEKPPTAHQGRAPDEFSTTLQKEEGVASVSAMARNPGVVAAMNKGAQVGGGNNSGPMLLVMDGEPMGRVMLKQLSGDGPAGGILDQRPGMSPGYRRGR